MTAAIWSFLLLNLLLGAPQIDYSSLQALIVFVGVLVPAVGFVARVFAVEVLQRKSVADHAEAPPAGARIGVDDSGLTIGSHSFLSDEIAIERLELDNWHREDDSRLSPRSLQLATPAGPLFIGDRIVNDGFRLVREIRRRLPPRAMAAQGADATRP